MVVASAKKISVSKLNRLNTEPITKNKAAAKLSLQQPRGVFEK